MRTGYTVKAEANCWDHQVLATILSTDRAGDVDVDPFATACTASTTPPLTPTNVRVLR
jgi:hypothetical protein